MCVCVYSHTGVDALHLLPATPQGQEPHEEHVRDVGRVPRGAVLAGLHHFARGHRFVDAVCLCGWVGGWVCECTWVGVGVRGCVCGVLLLFRSVRACADALYLSVQKLC